VIRVILYAIALLAIAVPALLVRFSPSVPPGARAVAAKLPPRRVVPAAELPAVEPVELVTLDPEDARAYNASVPFAPGPYPAARPFRFPGGSEDRARAVDCLAAALVYEAGDDTAGEKAVAQVILNRLRHPAFPKTVCGVVFEGSTRSTGCQFTFTCDGALRRWRPSPDRWARAQLIAAQALNGSVYRPVGHATHYHTDWVVPYWQSSLDKISKVGTHLFFRWTGWWGTPGAFTRRPSGEEPVVAALAPLTGVDSDAPDPTVPDDDTAAEHAGFTPTLDDQNSFLATLPAGVPPELWPELAIKACGDREECRFSAWADRTRTPVLLPLSAQQVASMSFAYLRDRSGGLERTLWNCAQTPRADPRQCMRAQVLLPTPAPLASPAPLATPLPPRLAPELEGVRRRIRPPGTAPAPRPSASPRPLRSDDGAILSPAAAAPQRSVP
jgi:spore germination cell wall hydrolase CwlJ-like protein